MEQIDTLKNGYKIFQDSKQFMFGIDAVLLAHFASEQLHKSDTVFDLCTGNGIIPLLITNKVKNTFGIEIQKESAELAKKSVKENNLEEKISIIEGDLKSFSSKNNPFEQIKRHSFNCVTCNPPYMINQHGQQNQLDAKTIARHEIYCNFDDIVKAADFLLHTHGKFFLIHRPFRLPEIFSTLQKYKLEPKRMKLVYPFENKEPNLVLIEARKDASARLLIEKPLVVYKEAGVYTDEIIDLYSKL